MALSMTHYGNLAFRLLTFANGSRTKDNRPLSEPKCAYSIQKAKSTSESLVFIQGQGKLSLRNSAAISVRNSTTTLRLWSIHRTADATLTCFNSIHLARSGIL